MKHLTESISSSSGTSIGESSGSGNSTRSSSDFTSTSRTLTHAEEGIVTVTISGPDFHDSEEFPIRDPRTAKAKARKLMAQAIKAYSATGEGGEA